MEQLYALKFKDLWLSIKRQPMAFKFLCIYFFFEYVRPQSLYPVIDILPWSQSFMGLTLLAALSNSTIKIPGNTQNRLLVLFGFIIILSGVFAFEPMAAWKYRNTMLGWMIAYFLVISIINSEERFFIFLLAYLLFNLKMGQHGAIEWIRRGFSFASIGLMGAPGPFRNSGEYAIQMIIFGSLAVAFVLSLKEYWGRYKKWIFFAAASTGYLAVAGASSRGAQLGMAVIGVWFMLKQKNGVKGLVLLGAISMLIYNLLPEEQMRRFSEMGNDVTSLQRLAYWEAGIEIIKEYPVLGVGYHNWIPYVSYMHPEGLGILQKIQVPHNIFILSGAELGFVGTSCFLMMIVVAFKMNVQTRILTRKENRFLYNMSLGLDAGLIGYLVAGFFVTVLYYPFFWIQIAMITALNRISVKIEK